MAASKMGYCEALEWLISNDDCEFYTEDYLKGVIDGGCLSVTGSFVADCYRKTDDELARALLALVVRIRRAG